MSKNVLITTSSFGVFSQGPIKVLEENGYRPIINPHGRKVSTEELAGMIEEYKPVGILAGTEKISKEAIGIFSGLKCISRIGVGWDNVDHDAAKAGGVQVFRTPDAVTPAVAELTLGLVLDLLRKVTLQNNRLKDGVWKKEMGSLLQGKTLGVFGAGRIGKRVGELAYAFGAHICALDPYQDENWAAKTNARYVKDLSELGKESDIICIHTSYQDSMAGLFNAAFFEEAKRELLLVNLSRGELIVEEALISALKNKLIGGAALDVFQKEPYEGELTKLDNALLTPHIGSYARESRVAMEQEAVENFLSCMK